MTFEQWQATRKWHNDLSKAGDNYDWPTEVAGFTYEPGGVIEAPAGGAAPDIYTVCIFNEERQFASLENAERWLWDDYVTSECAEEITGR